MPYRYPLNLPIELKRQATLMAKRQGISLNQFFLWSISEKVTELKSNLDDPNFPLITYRRGASGIPTPVLSGSGIRVETIVVSHYQWKETQEQLADDYGIPIEAVKEAIAFYEAHKEEVDSLIRIEKEIEARRGKTKAAS